MILMSYDGSTDAQAAIDHAARLLPGTPTTVLTVWEPFIDLLTRSGSLAAGVGGYGDAAAIDEASREAALATATSGAERATAAGLKAQPRIEARHAGIGQAVLAVADEIDADVIVMGTRGLSGVKSFLVGSVSGDVVQHADRAVMIVPSPALAEQRHDRPGGSGAKTG
jgi:nucleotide-binding universal stress UspA family protein